MDLSYLKEVNLSDNQLSSHHCKSIANLILHSQRLTVLNLRLNSITDSGGRFILAASTVSKSLESLSLSSNRLGAESFLIVVSMIDQELPLKRLDLSNNNFKNLVEFPQFKKVEDFEGFQIDLRNCWK
ncbi:hypothetical protein GEMRC1_001342 [Eukaryota sp. GEM-RC1]